MPSVCSWLQLANTCDSCGHMCCCVSCSGARKLVVALFIYGGWATLTRLADVCRCHEDATTASARRGMRANQYLIASRSHDKTNCSHRNAACRPVDVAVVAQLMPNVRGVVSAEARQPAAPGVAQHVVDLQRHSMASRVRPKQMEQVGMQV